jgi:hypothetical protein
MKPAAFLPLFLVVGFTIRASAQSRSTLPKEDTQVWSELQVALPLQEKIELNLIGHLRLGRNVTHLVDERVGGNFAFKLGKYITLSPGYLYIATQPVAGKKGYENRPSLAATIRFSLGGFTITDRNLFERRLRKPVNSSRYRNRLQLEHPIGIARLRAFIADEVFYDWSAGGWVRNRLSIGVIRKFSEHFSSEFYYMRQNDGRTRPGDLHVLGTTLRIRP